MSQLQPRQDNCKTHSIPQANSKYPNRGFPKYFLTINCNHRFLAESITVLTRSTSTHTHTHLRAPTSLNGLTIWYLSPFHCHGISKDLKTNVTFSTYLLRKACAQILFTVCIVTLLKNKKQSYAVRLHLLAQV